MLFCRQITTLSPFAFISIISYTPFLFTPYDGKERRRRWQ
ncbi:hypothetical protein GS8_2186 [Geobacillus stearothermophilus]|uniref:Uncharacterized protein n=1 Tax=Geobacillus stearothermophilus TaxID=1422 RepID=A0ABQ7HCV2_GEOSE|nr:hypothetical protein GS8_2186 [Geobacillus stearothermophilus]